MPIDQANCIAFWAEFVQSLAPSDSRRSAKPDAFGFGGEGELADELAALALTGKKKATASLPMEYTSLNEPLPKAGDLSIILDGKGDPVGIIERMSVDLVPFQEVDAEFAAYEGEGDGSLDYWREAHMWYFTQVCKKLGGKLEDSTPILCQRFKLVWPQPATDTGARLRSLYEPEGGVAQIFSPKVADYLASRPDYPERLFESLAIACNLRNGAVVADIGAGTGLLTYGLLQHGYQVIAIEPNADMRAAADRLLSGFAGYRSEHGSAESIPAPPSSVDLIAAAQAFHWFDIDRSRAEFLRVLRPEGKVALIWNDRVLTDPLHIALDEIFARYGGTKRGALVAHESRGDLPKFFGATVPAELTWNHEHCLDQSGLLSLVFSRSYIPDRNSPVGHEVSHHVREAFQRFATEAGVIVRYRTIAFVGRPSDAKV